VKRWRYQVRGQIEVAARAERVYEVATDPKNVPAYVPEVARVELLEKLDERTQLVRSHVRIGRFTFARLYRYHYRPPTHYGGAQATGRLLRGYFSLTFEPRGARTTLVTHVEGVQSPVPLLARLVGLLYFRVLARGGTGEELRRLKRLAEGESQRVSG
jgi:hypothetical protein